MKELGVSLATLLVLALILGSVGCNCVQVTPTPSPTLSFTPSPTPTPTTTPPPSVSNRLVPIGHVTIDGRTFVCYDETALLSDLLNPPSHFSDFYHAERAKMPEQIYWVEDQSLPFSVAAATDPTIHVTYLRNMPPSIEDSYIIAHELCTYLQQNEGFSGVRATDLAKNSNLDWIAGDLNTMVSMTVRDKMLKKYGFDLEKAYEWQIDGFFESVYPHSTELDKIWCMTFYVQIMLYWKDALAHNYASPFGIIYGQKYADILDDCNKMLNMIETNGYETAKEWTTLFPKIIEEFNLDKWVLYEGNTTAP